MRIILPYAPVSISVDGVRYYVRVENVGGSSAVWALRHLNPSRAEGFQLSASFADTVEGVRITSTVGFELFAPEHPQLVKIISALREVQGVVIVPQPLSPKGLIPALSPS